MTTVARGPVRLLAAAVMVVALAAAVGPAEAVPTTGARGAANVGVAPLGIASLGVASLGVAASLVLADAPDPLRCPRTFTRAHVRTCLERARAAYVRAWRKELRRMGITPRSPRLVIWSGDVANPCIDLGEGDVVTASFFCEKNRTIYASRTAARYWTKGYAREAARVHVLASDAATARTTTANLRRGFPLIGATTELAHEAGHWVQQNSGQLRWYLVRIASKKFARSNRYKLASELAADCLGGWVQGRVAASGVWRDKGIDRWAQHATMAELGADLTGLAPGFTFPKETPPLIAYGGPYSRLRFYDLGYAAGTAHKRGLRVCARAAAAYTSSAQPPHA